LQHLSGDFPTEVAPLAAELNDVLDMREKSLERARRRAGDLAHGLKTPLTVLSAIARDIRKRKLVKQSEEIEEPTPRRHVERALARARLSTGRSHVTTPLRPAVDKVVSALARLPKGDELDWDVHVPAEATVPLEAGDLTELLGNLLDNARQWAENRVKIHYETPLLTIEDDGPGVPRQELGRIGERGRRPTNRNRARDPACRRGDIDPTAVRRLRPLRAWRPQWPSAPTCICRRFA
jgi:signal transduction histidine kinase